MEPKPCCPRLQLTRPMPTFRPSRPSVASSRRSSSMSCRPRTPS
jgi:hypothetical protein